MEVQAKQASQNDPFSLHRSAASLHEVAHLVSRLAKHADHLPCATAETADLHTNLQALSDDLALAAGALKTQCQPCLENLAAVQGLSCSDELMDALLHRIFSSKSTEMEDAGEPMLSPMLSPMTSSDALATCQLLNGIVTQNRHTSHEVNDDQLDSLLYSLPSRSSPCDTEGEEHTLLRELSLDGGAEPQTTFARLRSASSGLVLAAPETQCH